MAISTAHTVRHSTVFSKKRKKEKNQSYNIVAVSAVVEVYGFQTQTFGKLVKLLASLRYSCGLSFGVVAIDAIKRCK